MSTTSSLDGLFGLVESVRNASSADASTVKSCCAAAYGADVVPMFLGDSYHPGGAALTRRLADMLSLQPSQRVLDVASGIGTTALFLASEFDVEVLGVDLGVGQVAKARTRAASTRLAGRALFEVGDAEQLPVDDASFDAAVCECAFCTFPSKATAAAELARVVRRDGRIGIADVWLEPTHLDPELADLAGRVACLADARPIAELCTILEVAGLVVEHIERYDEALLETIERVEARLRALRILDVPLLRPFNLRRGIDLARRAADVVRRGDAGYVLLVAARP
jgi:ubiquinone/menaquinone biosynthesis C-methylase UbiE